MVVAGLGVAWPGAVRFGVADDVTVGFDGEDAELDEEAVEGEDGFAAALEVEDVEPESALAAELAPALLVEAGRGVELVSPVLLPGEEAAGEDASLAVALAGPVLLADEAVAGVDEALVVAAAFVAGSSSFLAAPVFCVALGASVLAVGDAGAEDDDDAALPSELLVAAFIAAAVVALSLASEAAGAPDPVEPDFAGSAAWLDFGVSSFGAPALVSGLASAAVVFLSPSLTVVFFFSALRSIVWPRVLFGLDRLGRLVIASAPCSPSSGQNRFRRSCHSPRRTYWSSIHAAGASAVFTLRC